MLIKDLGHHKCSQTNSESTAIPHSIFFDEAPLNQHLSSKT